MPSEKPSDTPQAELIPIGLAQPAAVMCVVVKVTVGGRTSVVVVLVTVVPATEISVMLRY